MCGIFFAAYQGSYGEDGGFLEMCQRLEYNNAARGPDAQRVIVESLEATEPSGSSSPLHLRFFSSELRLRGTQPIVQPHERDGSILCWNGEIFEGLDLSAADNDGVELFQRLNELSDPAQIPAIFSKIEGPYAFAFYHYHSRQLVFARDPLGRRSLLIHRPKVNASYFLLSSVSMGSNALYDLEEVSATGFYFLDIEALRGSCKTQMSEGFPSCLRFVPRDANDQAATIFGAPRRVLQALPTSDIPIAESLGEIPPEIREDVEGLIDHLDRSVRLRVQNIPDHSNHLGHPKVALLFSGGIDCSVLAYLAHKTLPIDEPIDLLNVAFENSYKAKAAESIGLKQHKLKAGIVASSPTPYMVPDRVTGLQEVDELRRICPGRVWNFVEVNVTSAESASCRSTVEGLMWPSRTVMDLSLALALYFASRGIGQLRDGPDMLPRPYTSTARVLLSGLGSDELFGGYSRHRVAFSKGGWQGLIEELQLEIDRIPQRNLGRDDRVISCHGKEVRLPFLSLTVLDYAVRLPVHHKVDPRLPIGVGDKLLLRLAAHKLGLVEASSRKKRAMQFGSWSARMQGEKNGNVSLE